MNIIDEYDLDMYKNLVMTNNCKDEELLCIFNTSSFLNTMCFFLFFIMFLWFLSIVSRFYASYNIMKYLKNRKAIYMKNMSRYINEVKMLCRSHVNDIIRIKKKITPKSVDKINLNISVKNNIQLYKNYLSSSCNDLNQLYKYSISFTFSSKNSLYIRLFWGVLLKEVNEIIHNRMELNKKSINGPNTVICIDNFKNFFKDGFSKSIPNKQISDATTLLLDKKKNDYYLDSKDDEMIDFNTCFYKSPKSFFSNGNNVTYTMPYDENFCVTEILNEIEVEKTNVIKQKEKEENENKKKKLKKNKIDVQENTIMSNEDNIRIPLIIVLNDIPSDDQFNLNKASKKPKKNDNCNTLIVLVDFKKIKDKYKPFIIKDICVLNQNVSSQKSKKKCNIVQFIDILDIYGHEEHDKECLICMTSYKDTLLMPCRHSSFCYDCMKSLRQEKCPICRCLFTSFIKFPLKNIDKNEIT
ncbi:E3 ubiquitin-protein ligase, putative [Plasmodium gallinaceum]|uniref:E3 ubiquitin-protein ligase, putative n=1 Tax=Plasmodium gallinaceum TaxID=5849 RepID=A0A1J1GP95_PLAGA|nr:E3 ubiquitin-protein ligase, putative [Plasmodium gallinaceum]CRG94290.1 E3 ubiquitin-protein ligase, putative [Plasmodium gallinaceum]